MSKIIVEKDRCKGCELCKNVCPRQIIAMSKELNVKGYFYSCCVDESKCTGCTFCALMCPDVAITVYRSSPKKAKE